MISRILDASIRAAWHAAASQPAQLATVSGAWAGGNVRLRYYSAAGVLLDTVTHGPFTVAGTTRLYLIPGAILARTPASGDAAAYCIASIVDGADILRCEVTLGANVSSECRTNLGSAAGAGDGLRVLADAGLPASELPTWLFGVAVGEMVSLADTDSIPGGLDPDAFCGWTLKPDTGDLYLIAAGGHTNSGSNAVARLRLTDDAPAWGLRLASSWDGSQVNVTHYTGGRPAARHTYHHVHWVSSLARFLMVGASYLKGDGNNEPAVDGYDPATDTYDAAGTYTEVPRVGGPGTAFGFGVVQDSDGYIWADHDRRYYPTTDTWDFPSVTSRIGGAFPQTHCPTLNLNFGLQWGNGQAAGSGINAYKRDISALTDTAITFSTASAAAVAQFISDAPAYAGMDWDAPNSRFLFYAGGTRIYAITPNSGSEWDMEILSVTGYTPSAAGSGGVNSKWTYVDDIGGVSGFVGMSVASGGVFFLRTA